MTKGERWVTINGRHVLIGANGVPVRDKDRAVFTKHVKVGNDNVIIGDKSKHDYTELVEHRWEDEDEDHKTYSKLMRQSWQEKEKYTNEWMEANKEAKKHYIQDKDDIDPFLKELGLGGHYDEEGKVLKTKADTAYEQMKKMEENYNRWSAKESSSHKRHAMKEFEDWTQERPNFTPATQKSYKGFDEDNKTHVPHYDSLIEQGKGQLVEMSPKEYMQRIAYDIFGSTMERTAIDSVDRAAVEKYAKMMKEGTKFHVGYINYADRGREGQEGRHRALAAYMLGYDKIPVWIFR